MYAELGFYNAEKFKRHLFRRYFASLCANLYVAHRKALTWLGHNSPDILELYYHLTNDESQAAMSALAGSAAHVEIKSARRDFEGNLRANGQSKIETLRAKQGRAIRYETARPANGEAGIRTRDTGLTPYNGLANRRLQPLGHLSRDFQSCRNNQM